MTDRRPPDPADVARFYDASAEGFDERFASSARTVEKFRRIDAPQVAVTRGANRVLELGCGTGRLLGQLHGRVRLGLDVSRDLLAQAAAKGHVAVRADANALPFADASIDAICAGNGVFRYLDYPRVFAECHRVLAPGGRLSLHQYARWTRSLARPYRRAEGDIPLHVADLDELRAPAKDAGLVERSAHAWRSLRFFPYVLRLPPRLATGWWSHLVMVFERPR